MLILKTLLAYSFLFFEMGSFIMAVINFRYLKKTFWCLIVPFLGFICMSELLITVEVLVWHVKGVFMNYIVGIIESIFYGYLFFKLTQAPAVKTFFIFLSVFGVSIYLFGLIVARENLAISFYSVAAAGIFTCVQALTYLYISFKKDDQSRLIDRPGFWVASGVIMFYSGISLVFTLFEFIQRQSLRIFTQSLATFVVCFFCFILYGSFFICIVVIKRQSLRLKQSNNMVFIA